MTTKEAIYLLRNTAWLAPSLEPIDEAIEMACEALDNVEYINRRLGKADRKTENCSEIPNNCTSCECTDDCSERKAAEHGCKTEPQKAYDEGYRKGMKACNKEWLLRLGISEPQTERSE